jgi:hypothetical protein
MKQIFAALLLTGCAATQAPLPAPSQDTCNATTYGTLIGQPATALERVLLMGKVRVIRPNQPVTKDFWPDRINFMIDESEVIASISCA